MSSEKNVVNKFTRQFFNLKSLLPKKDGSRPTDRHTEQQLERNVRLLQNCALMYDSLGEMRRERQENVDYYFGRQLKGRVPNADGCTYITEEQYLLQQNMIPLTINVIRSKVKTIVGVFRSDRMEPLAISRVREEQRLGELMTTTMQYTYNVLNLWERYAREYEEHLTSAIPCMKVYYDWDERRKIEDVQVERVDINDMFWDNNTSGEFFENISTIGRLHDMSLAEVLQLYATSASVRQQIEAAYQTKAVDYPETRQQFDKEEKSNIQNFFETRYADKCRVIEIWRKESFEVIPCWDTAKGESYTLPFTDESIAELQAENQRRQMEMLEAGGDPQDAAIIKCTNDEGDIAYRVDTFWVCYYMTPSGYILKKDINPYLHGSHPYVIGAFPLINGEIHSLVSDTRNAQRMINRLITSAEFERMNRAKGAIVVQLDVLEQSNMTIEQFSAKYTDPKGVIGLRWKEGQEIVKRLSDQTGNADDNAKLQFYMQIIEEITGAHSALRGEKPNSGTPASLYAQETQNANNNIADGQEWFYSFIQQVDYKIMMLQLQHYDRRRFIEIAGADFMREVDYIINTPERQRNALFDLQLIKSPSTGIARAQSEQMLQTLFESGAITATEWLDNTMIHGADKISEQVKQRQQETQEQQVQMQQ